MTTPPPPSDDLMQHLAEYDLSVGELALALRAIVLAEARDANELVYKSYVLAVSYSFTPKWGDGFCYIGVYARHVNLGFIHGAGLEDPDGLLEGHGTQMRHIKIKQPKDLKQAHLRAFLRASIKQSKVTLAAKMAKTAKSAKTAKKSLAAKPKSPPKGPQSRARIATKKSRKKSRP